MQKSSSEEILLPVRHVSNAHQMLERVKQTFVGTISSQRSKLEDRFMSLQFRGSSFQFVNETQGIIAELASVDVIQSYTNFILR